jgi:hypothetical protein
MKIEVVFKYRESCSHVYKKVVFLLNGEGVTARKKEIKELLQDAPKIVTANTYFWRPGGRAKDRRRNEALRINEVKAWLESKGFSVEDYCESGYDVVKGVKEVVEV